MDVRIEETIDQPYASVLQAMLGDSGKWLPGLARDAANRLVTDLALASGQCARGSLGSGRCHSANHLPRPVRDLRRLEGS
jgi:hypothetical protein